MCASASREQPKQVERMTNVDGKRLKKIEEIPREEVEQRRAAMIQAAKGHICPGFSYELSRKELNAIMNMESPPTSTERLIRKACEERVRVMRTMCATNEAFVKRKSEIISAGGYWPVDVEENAK